MDNSNSPKKILNLVIIEVIISTWLNICRIKNHIPFIKFCFSKLKSKLLQKISENFTQLLSKVVTLGQVEEDLILL